MFISVEVPSHSGKNIKSTGSSASYPLSIQESQQIITATNTLFSKHNTCWITKHNRCYKDAESTSTRFRVLMRTESLKLDNARGETGQGFFMGIFFPLIPVFLFPNPPPPFSFVIISLSLSRFILLSYFDFLGRKREYSCRSASNDDNDFLNQI